MIWIVFSFIVIALIFAIFIKFKQKSGSSSHEHSYKKIDSLFSPAERSFLGVLSQAVDGNAFVFGKVRMADVIKPEQNSDCKLWQIAFNKINSKHFDFVLCDKNDLSVLCVIELDDKSHNSKSRQLRDAFLSAACVSACLPLIQVPAKAGYNIDELRQMLIAHLSAG